MSLRIRAYSIHEATYEYDLKIRRVAENFYKSLVRFLRNRLDELTPRKDGGFSILDASVFWDHPKARNLGIVFVPKPNKTGTGRAGNITVLFFPFVKKKNSKDGIYSNVKNNMGLIIHEIVHVLDPGRGKKGGIKRYRPKGKAIASKYYNDDSEWNAYWQEGASKLERFYKDDNKRKNVNLKDLQRKLEMFWDKGFLINMNKKTRRKFDKRLYDLWMNVLNKD